MTKKKNFKIQQSNIIPVSLSQNYNRQSLVYHTDTGIVDFNRWNYFNRPDSKELDKAVHAEREQLVSDFYNAVTQLSFEMSKITVEFLAKEGCKQIFQFLDYKHNNNVKLNNIESFSKDVIEDFLIWIRNRPAKTKTGKMSMLAARRYYSSVKSILSYFIRMGRLSNDIFPYSPFVNINRSAKVTVAYSKSEMSRIMRYLWQKLELIRKGQFKGSFRQILAIYALIIAAKTGRNTSTILRLNVDCITPHPLAPDSHIILTGFKKRGMNTSVQAMRSSYDIVDTFSINKDIGTLIHEVSDLTNELRTKSDKNCLFIITDTKRNIKPFSDQNFWRAVQEIYNKAQLKDDQGNLLRFQVKRMRKTFAERVWQLTGGDPVKTAKVLGNTIPILNKHYLDVTPEMEKRHKMFGYVLTESLLNTDGDIELKLSKILNILPEKVNDLLIGNFNTTVSRCSDPIGGKFSNGDGTPCCRFTRCFTCPNQVIIESDLYRLFSFYWLILREKGFIGKRKWKTLYSDIINVIDTEVSESFDEEVIKNAKEEARIKPHPAWRSRCMLERL